MIPDRDDLSPLALPIVSPPMSGKGSEPEGRPVSGGGSGLSLVLIGGNRAALGGYCLYCPTMNTNTERAAMWAALAMLGYN